jgi:hypothetical protein
MANLGATELSCGLPDHITCSITYSMYPVFGMRGRLNFWLPCASSAVRALLCLARRGMHRRPHFARSVAQRYSRVLRLTVTLRSASDTPRSPSFEAAVSEARLKMETAVERLMTAGDG